MKIATTGMTPMSKIAQKKVLTTNQLHPFVSAIPLMKKLREEANNMLKYWLAEQVITSHFQVHRYTLVFYWLVRYGATQADLLKLEKLRLTINTHKHFKRRS